MKTRCNKSIRTGWIAALCLGVLSAAPLSAAQYDIKEMTPEVQNAISARQGRFEQIQSLKAQGALGENNRGYVEARSGGAGSVADAENADRRTIYRTIADQNGLGTAGLEVIEQVFAEVQRDKARPGDQVQLPSGEWTQK